MKWRHRIALATWAAATLLLPSWSLASSSFPDRYDLYFLTSAKRFLPAPATLYGYELLKAQAWQESRFDAAAVSPAGATGVMQFMPGTWREAQRALGLGDIPPTHAQQSIRAGAWYMARMRSVWTAPRPEQDRYSLALASYNAGAGHLIRAQRLCGGRNLYHEIAACLPQVTGDHARETLGYVPRIWGYWERMRLGR